MNEKKKTSDAQLKAIAKWEASKRRYAIRLDPEEATILEISAQKSGQSINAYVIQAIRDRISRESSK